MAANTVELGSIDNNPFDEIDVQVNEHEGTINNTESFESTDAEDASFLNEQKRKKNEEEITNASCFSIKFYQPYFDIDTESELLRLKRSLQFWDRPFFRTELNEKPDLYGPFWIATSLAFMMAAFGNFARFINSEKDAREAWHSDVEKISNAAWGLYLSLLFIPLLIKGIMSYSGVSKAQIPSVIELVSLYGYSLFAYVPACVLCVVPFGWFRWLVVCTAFGLSTALLLTNIYVEDLQKDRKRALPLLLLVLACQGALALLMRFYFFEY